jgi:hypothetical protein
MRATLAEIRREHEPEKRSNGNEKRATIDHYMTPNGLVPALVDSLLVDTVTWWLEQGRPYPPVQVATYCWRLIVAMLKEASSWQ